MPSPTSAPRSLTLSVALIAAAMLLVELLATRIFSVLFFYHYSFFAICLIMSGLAFGGLIAARWDIRAMDERAFRQRLAACALACTGGVVGVMIAVTGLSHAHAGVPDASVGPVALQAAVFLPGLTAAGAFLAAAFARDERWINRLYACDLAAAALACLGAILLMRTVPGTATLLVPSLLAAAAAFVVAPRRSGLSLLAGTASGVLLMALIGGIGFGWGILRLNPGATKPVLERWNEHSRVLVVPISVDPHATENILIDRTANTLVPKLAARAPGAPPPVEPWWDDGEAYLAYRTGRPLDHVAIIGIGGGRDALAPVASGAGHIDGYELNGIIADYHTDGIPRERSLASWPEISFIHEEARVGISHAGVKYDVIQASMIDTWAATASGGFVLSESSLYTREGWGGFLKALADGGILTMTRWALPEAETHRLVALACGALEDAGIADPRQHVVLAGPDARRLSTILVSKSPFTADEVARLRAICRDEGLKLAAAPGSDAGDPGIRRLLDPATRRAAILESPFDISVPTDLRPYFFLLVRPRDILQLPLSKFSVELEITLNGIRILMVMVALSVLFAGVVFAIGVLNPRSNPAEPGLKSLQRRTGLYFLCIGLGYILIQLGVHQRLILILGHPTYALSVVLFSMLLGTGFGSLASGRLFPEGNFMNAWLVMLTVIIAALACFPHLSMLEELDSPHVRAALAGLLTGGVGFALGFGFPLGVRLAASAGDRAVQRMWAVNGAASIAGTALAAINGVMWGSRANLVAGLLLYAAASLAGKSAESLVLRRKKSGGFSMRDDL